MTDWSRVERLRRQGKSWREVAGDEAVRFRGRGGGTDAGRALKQEYLLRRSRIGSSPKARAQAASQRVGASPWTKRRLALLGAILAIAVATALLVAEYGPANSSGPGNWIGRSAPDFTLPSTSGSSFTLSHERGQKNVLLFFNEGLSCSPCLNQMVQLDQDAAQYTSMNVVIVQITGDSLSDMTTWAQQNGIMSTQVLADPSLGVCNAYQTTGPTVSMMPGTAPGHTFVLVNLNGTVVWRHDYGPNDMSVPNTEIYQAVVSALG